MRLFRATPTLVEDVWGYGVHTTHYGVRSTQSSSAGKNPELPAAGHILTGFWKPQVPRIPDSRGKGLYLEGIAQQEKHPVPHCIMMPGYECAGSAFSCFPHSVQRGEGKQMPIMHASHLSSPLHTGSGIGAEAEAGQEQRQDRHLPRKSSNSRTLTSTTPAPLLITAHLILKTRHVSPRASYQKGFRVLARMPQDRWQIACPSLYFPRCCVFRLDPRAVFFFFSPCPPGPAPMPPFIPT